MYFSECLLISLINVRVEFFARLYQFVYERLAAGVLSAQPKRYRLKLYDSTFVATCAHLLDAMRVGHSSGHKRQVKLTTELTDQLLVRVAFFKEQKYLSENTALRQMIGTAVNRTEEIAVFDLGLSSRRAFTDLTAQGVKFVTRGKHNLRYRVIKERTAAAALVSNDRLELLEDQLVHLYGAGQKEIEQPFRLIKARRREDDKILCFITNVEELTAGEIAEIYRRRWDIEVFFKFMKQEMNLKHFLCHDENAIKVMLYCTLIAAMLVLAYKQGNQIKSFKIAKIRFFKQLHLDLIEELVEHRNGTVWVKNMIKLNKAQLK